MPALCDLNVIYGMEHIKIAYVYVILLIPEMSQFSWTKETMGAIPR